MVLPFPSSNIKSTIPVIFFNIMADGADRADDDGRNAADAGETRPTRTNSSQKENCIVSPTDLKHGNDGIMFHQLHMQGHYLKLLLTKFLQ